MRMVVNSKGLQKKQFVRIKNMKTKANSVCLKCRENLKHVGGVHLLGDGKYAQSSGGTVDTDAT
jgi:hypothetical protein